ncbi:MAG: response regulator [Nitrospiraceae bacterium]|nr:response regulator [Nitrospiraceae bacterium]
MVRPRVLIVEDEIIAGMNLQALCERWGFRVGPLVTSAEEAVAVAEAERPDIILMDISLHGSMDGIQAAELIRRRSETPILFMSGYSDEQILERVRAVEHSVHILKPLDFKGLQRIMGLLLCGGGPR